MEVEIWVSTNRVGSTERRTIHVPDEDFEDVDEMGREEYMREEFLNLCGDMYDWGWGVKD